MYGCKIKAIESFLILGSLLLSFSSHSTEAVYNAKRGCMACHQSTNQTDQHQTPQQNSAK